MFTHETLNKLRREHVTISPSQALAAALKQDKAEARIFNVGQLLGLDWKLGVSLSASSCPKLQSPFVTLRIRTRDGSGVLQTKCVELTLDEFNVSE